MINRTKIYCLLCGLLTAAAGFAAPARNRWQTKMLTDGTIVELRLIGDENGSFWETTDGQVAEEQSDGRFVLTAETASDARKKLRKSPNPRMAIGTPSPIGKVPVILVQFADTKFKATNDSAGLSDMYNKAGYDYEGAYGSAADYFKAQSDGKYVPVFEVLATVTLNHDAAYYGGQSGSVSDQYIADFVIDAVAAADAAGCDFSLYDSNSDNYVDVVSLVYAGKGQADGGGTETIWPHSWTLSDALFFGRTHGGTGYSYTKLPKCDGRTINNYVCACELDGYTEARAGIGTFCHEFSHVIGMPDYYPTLTTASTYDKNYTPGAWSVMDQGIYTNDGKTPPNYSAYDKAFMKWLTPKTLPKDEATDVALTTAYVDAYKIGDYWYVENRQKTGWDSYLPGHGMCVWEVHYNSSDWKNNVVNNSAVGYTIVTANNLTKPYKPYVVNPSTSSVSATPFPGTANVTSYTPATGYAMTKIKETDGVITFALNGGAAEYTYELVGDYCSVPSDGAVLPGEPLELVITPDDGYTLADAACWMVSMGAFDLTYGTDFTYDASTSTFRIAGVTGDVVILAEAQVYVPTGNEEKGGVGKRRMLRMENGMLYILSGGEKYTVLGTRVE